jgi:U3 small nucleolar RNA-associated protein 18
MALRHPKTDESKVGSFIGFDREGRHSSVDMESDNDDVDILLNNTVLEKDSDEEELERLVLGNKAGFRERLFRDDFLTINLTAFIRGPNDDT